jgi:hypothetical protein
MPLVAARLPVLKAFDVPDNVLSLSQAKAVLLEESGYFGDCGVFELLQPGGQQVVDDVGGPLRVVVEESLDHQHAIVDLAFLFRFSLVGEDVVAQMHPIGERVFQHPHWPGRGDPGRDLDEHGVLDEVHGLPSLHSLSGPNLSH